MTETYEYKLLSPAIEMKTFLFSLFGIYLAICLALFLLQRKVLYFPQPVSDFSSLQTNLETIRFETDGETLEGWVVNSDRPKALLYYGGNAENIEQNIAFFQSMKLDYSFYFIPYRGYGHSSGSPSEQKIYQDALYIFDQVSPQHTQLSLMGRSLGSGVATHVAARREVDKLILVTAYDSIENVAKSIYWMLPISLLIKDKYRSWENASTIKAETLLLSAGRDEVIPWARTENLIAHFSKQKLESVIIPNAGHNDISLYPEFALKIKTMLNSSP